MLHVATSDGRVTAVPAERASGSALLRHMPFDGRDPVARLPWAAHAALRAWAASSPTATPDEALCVCEVRAGPAYAACSCFRTFVSARVIASVSAAARASTDYDPSVCRMQTRSEPVANPPRTLCEHVPPLHHRCDAALVKRRGSLGRPAGVSALHRGPVRSTRRSGACPREFWQICHVRARTRSGRSREGAS